jgi:hypothetical protein
MAWRDGGLDYAENDLFAPGAKGSVFRIEFASSLSATRSVMQSGLFDPSGLTSAEVEGRRYLLVNESRLGYLVGTEQGLPALPYQVRAFALK